MQFLRLPSPYYCYIRNLAKQFLLKDRELSKINNAGRTYARFADGS